MLTLVLARVFGLVMLVVGLGMITRKDYYQKTLAAITKDPAALFLGGISAVIIGIFMVTYHNIWTDPLAVVITLIGWLGLLKGLLILLFPGAMIQMIDKMIATKKFISAWGLIAAILGVVLFYSSMAI